MIQRNSGGIALRSQRESMRSHGRSFIERMEDRVLLATFDVTSAADSGAGSLRDAIIQANANSETDLIRFNIPGVGAHTITLASALPQITQPVVIDATTQSGFAGSPVIELTAPKGHIFEGLYITAGSSTVRGLAINGFQSGIRLGGAGGNIVSGNYLGTDVTGTLAVGNQDGIFLESRSNTIGGLTAGERNVISGNGGKGIRIEASGNVIVGNFIGVDASGAQPLGNGTWGIEISTGASGTVIGGASPGSGNVISANGQHGIMIHGSDVSNARIQGNRIGTDATGQLDRGNHFSGIYIESTGPLNTRIGGVEAGAGNVIAYNQSSGVHLNIGYGVAIRGNAIFFNGWRGINLGSSVVPANDAGDGDTGPNQRQNFPVLSSSLNSNNTTVVSGTLNSTPQQQFSIDLFANTALDGSGNGQGQTYLGSVDVVTDATGNASFAAPLALVPAGRFITATATDRSGNTSEFSNGVVTAVPPAPVPPAPPAPASLPTARLGRVQVKRRAKAQQLSVVFSDQTGINASLVGTGDILVVRGKRFRQLARLVKKTPAWNAKSIQAVYRITPPGGSWDRADNGIYTVMLVGGQVSNAAGQFLSARRLGTFRVRM